MHRKAIWLVPVALALLALSVPAAAEDEACDGPQDIRATVHEDGILVEWDEWTFARAYEVYRAEGNGEPEQVAVTSGDNPMDGQVDPHQTSYFDEDVEPGTTYTYHVQALAPPPDTSDVCGEVSATAIPVFPTPLVGMAAAAAGAGMYVVLRRR